MDNPQKSQRRGCLFYGGLAAMVIIAVMLLGLYMGARYAKGVVNQLTDKQPVPLPTVQLPQAQMFQLHDRVDSFGDAIRNGEGPPPLELSADEVNALIATDPGLAALKNRVYVSFEGNQLRAQISFPAEDLGLDALRGRYVNASGSFHVSLVNGELRVIAESLTAKGKPVPRHIMRQIAAQNLATKFNADPKASAGLKKLQSIQVKNGKLVFEAKK